MITPDNGVINALDQIVAWSREREFPPGEWAAPMQDLLNGGDALANSLKWLPIPLAVYDRDGKVVLANFAMLDRLGIKDEHIEDRRINVYDVTDVEFRNAAKLAFRGDTSVVGGIRMPFACMGPMPTDIPKVVSAILFPVSEDKKTALRGAVMFLPFEYVNGDKKIRTEASDLRYGE